MKIKIGLRKTTPRRFAFLCVITVYLCLWVAVIPGTQQARASVIQTNSQSSVASQTGAAGSPTAPGAKPDVVECNLWVAFFVLVIIGILLWGLIEICRAAHLCGNTNQNPPPSNGGKGNNAMKSMGLTGNAKPDAPTGFSVSFSGNTVKSSDPSLTVLSLPFEINGQLVPNGSQLPAMPSDIAMWTVTNGVVDPLDANYPYAVAVNFSVLASTNLVEWHTFATVLAWINADPTNPLVCEIVYTNQVTHSGNIAYTNGIPVSTNWIQCNLDDRGAMTNMVMYGTPISSSSASPRLAHQFFRLWADTNEITTTGP